jgi:quercetin dioxygenase-like cupin family protein
MKIINLKEVEKSKVTMEGALNAWKQMPISKKDETPNYSLRVFTVEPQGHTPFHSHNYEHLNYIISGQGAIIDENGNEKPISTGEFALVLPNEKHQYINKSTIEPFVMICGVPKEFE